jgi:hypothetical protein
MVSRKGVDMAKWNRNNMWTYIKNTQNVHVLSRGVLSLFALQTAMEQENAKTKESNSRGFSVATVKVGSTMAKYLLGGGKMVNKAWIEKARKVCLFHARQLAEIANGGELQEIRDAKFKSWGLWKNQ